jgi:hypothetical protein
MTPQVPSVMDLAQEIEDALDANDTSDDGRAAIGALVVCLCRVIRRCKDPEEILGTLIPMLRRLVSDPS